MMQMPQTQSLEAPEPENTKPRPHVHVHIKRTDTFNEEMHYSGTFVKASLTFDQDPDPLVFNRMLRHLQHDLKADLGCDDSLSPMSEAEVTSRNRNGRGLHDRIDIFSDSLNLRDIHMALRMVLSRYRHRDGFEVPKVTADDHKRMVEHGIKLRKDGLFGYHLLCNRSGCTNHVKTCYTQTDLQTAIWDKESRRSRFTCSTYCWLKETHPAEIIDDWYDCLPDDLREALDPYVEWEDEMDGDDAIRTAGGLDLDRIQSEKPDLLKRFGSFLADHCEPMDDAGESSCEV